MSQPGRIRRACAVVVALLLAGCSTTTAPAGPRTEPTSPPPAANSASNSSLKGICPDTIVMQMNWWPEPDHGAFYQLIGPNGVIDTDRNTYSGPIGTTGVKGEIRAGGAAVGFQSVTSQEYQDDTILLGLVTTDEQIGSSATQPTRAVFAWYARSPLILFWGNPAWDFKSVAEIGQNGAPVLAFQSATYLDVLIGKGLLTREQVDTSYTGDPSRFVAADGNIVSQGFVTSEPYIYENEVNGWKRPIRFLLVADDVPLYQTSVVVRADKLEANRACLQRLVPMLQQAGIDYARNPGPVNGVLTEFTSRIRGGTRISPAGAADAVQKMVSLGIVANGADGVFGSYDSAQVQKLIADYGPVFEARGKAPKANLQPADLVTNEFLDRTVKL